MKDRVITAHIPQDLAVEVDSLAEELDRPRGWIVKEALIRYVGLEQERHRLTREALAEVDAGRTLEHAAIERWASTLGRRRRSGRH